MGGVGPWCLGGRAILRPLGSSPTSETSPFGVITHIDWPDGNWKPPGKAVCSDVLASVYKNKKRSNYIK